MELKTLWLGLVLSMAAFAVKTGLGWAYLWRAGRPKKRLAASLFILGMYAAIFAAVAFFVSKINLLAHYGTLTPLWKNGVTLHWLVAIMLFIWGLILLRRCEDNCHSPSRGWLTLVIPCPVCLSVILISAASLVFYFPDEAFAATAGLFVAFMSIAALGGMIMIVTTRGGSGSAKSALGLAMLMMAAYFTLSALIAPQFAELSRVYRISAYAVDHQDSQLWPKLLTTGGILLLMSAGFFRARKHFGRQR